MGAVLALGAAGAMAVAPDPAAACMVAYAGADAHVWGRRRVTVSRETVSAWARGASYCARGGLACRPWRGSALQGPAAAGQQGGASRSRSVVQGAVVPSALPPCPWRVSGASAPGPPAVAACGGQGGAPVGGGGRSLGRLGTCVGPQQPNKGLQATANSLRSFLALAIGGA